MNNNNEQKRSIRTNIGMRKDLSQLSNLIKSINSQNDKEPKNVKFRLNKSINAHNNNFIIQNNLRRLASSDTLEKKKRSSGKKKKYRNKSISQRIVTNYKVKIDEIDDKEENEDYIDKTQIDLLNRKKHLILCFKFAKKKT